MGHLGLLVAGAMALSACGTATDSPAADGSEPEAPASAAASAAASAGGEQLRVALILPGETTDRGFNATGEMAADLIEEEYGADVAFTESVNPANQADVYRQYANQGYDLIIGWGGQFTDGAVEVAEEFADTYFLVVSSGASLWGHWARNNERHRPP